MINRFSITLLTFCAVGALSASHAAQNNNAFSQYGMIQNVQNYSSNPYWNPNSPYNLRMPSPVYATGPSVETSDCQAIVTSLIETQCKMRSDNCATVSVSDIRPAIILQLSRIPGGNYATSCAGYLDGALNEYKRTKSTTVPSTPPVLPTHAIPDTASGTEYQFQMPMPINTTTAHNNMQWMHDQYERMAELQALEQQTATYGTDLMAAEMPKTLNDVSFTTRMQNAASGGKFGGYETYADMPAYIPIELAAPTNPTPEKICGGSPSSTPDKDKIERQIVEYIDAHKTSLNSDEAKRFFATHGITDANELVILKQVYKAGQNGVSYADAYTKLSGHSTTKPILNALKIDSAENLEKKYDEIKAKLK